MAWAADLPPDSPENLFLRDLHKKRSEALDAAWAAKPASQRVKTLEDNYARAQGNLERKIKQMHKLDGEIRRKVEEYERLEEDY